MAEIEASKKVLQLLAQAQRIILDLNRAGMEYLDHEQLQQSLELLKKAEKLVEIEIRNNLKDPRLNKLAAITYNNIGCYYKKANKPKVALKYLNSALELEVSNVEDWVSTAGTHLNICAIHSYLGKHKDAADHASLSARLLEREMENSKGQDKKSPTQEQPALVNLLIVSYYNLGVEMEHLSNRNEALRVYRLGIEVATQQAPGNVILKSLKESYERVAQEIRQKESRASLANERKRDEEAKNYYEFMRKNKKNDPGSDYAVIKPVRKADYSAARKRFLSVSGSTMRKHESQVRMTNKSKLYPQVDVKAATQEIREI